MRLNPLDEVPPTRFKYALQKWIESGIPEGNVVEAILLDSHYKFKRVDIMVGLLDVIDKEEMASFLHDNATRTITVVCTTHTIKDDPTMWISHNQESFLQAMKHAKSSFKVVICLCDQNSFKNLFLMVMKSSHVMSFRFEFAQYMVGPTKVPCS